MAQNKALSSLVGGALGDALGYSREFVGTPEILGALKNNDWRNANFANVPKGCLQRDAARHTLISDDTQMTIATGRALIDAESIRGVTFAQAFETTLPSRYVTWSKHPDNYRAPGGACMRACKALSEGEPWQAATDIDTMGCGANMRVAPIALYMNPGAGSLIDLTYLSAAMTHAHPAALAAAALTTAAITGAYDGMTGTEILALLLDLCEHGGTYPTDVLGDLWKMSRFDSARAYLNAGYALCGHYLSRADKALKRGWKGQTDPCTITGQAWTAPEALAGAVLCSVGLWDKPVQVLQRAACSNGDSDSLAAIAGNIRGAAGVEWPEHLVSQLEQAPLRELHKLAKVL